MDARLEALDYGMIEGWREDDPSALLAAIGRVLAHMRTGKPYRTGSLGISPKELEDALAGAEGIAEGDGEATRRFLEENFRPFRIFPQGGGAGHVTAFYEPVVSVRAARDDDYCWPFYRRPDDLAEIDDENRPAGFDHTLAFGRKTADGLVPYPDRQAIDEGFLEGRGLEIAFARSRIDVFFAHIQGAARLQFENGLEIRITYDGKAGHAFTGIGRVLADLGEIDPAQVSMQSIRAWLHANPDRQSGILWKNRSYIFFRQAGVSEGRLGPVAAAKVALEPMRSVAVDRLIHTFGSLFFIRAETLLSLDGGKPFARTMIALDTGSAIIGPARADIFTGSGDEAGLLAGNVSRPADFVILIPRTAQERYG